MASGPIRGGIPLCWPWFSDDHGKAKGELPSHGFLRTQMWHIESVSDDDDSTTVLLKPSHTNAHNFSYACQVYLRVSIGKTLMVSLETTNTDSQAFTLNNALHTYFAVDSIKQVELLGLTGAYRDKLDDWAVKSTPSPYRFSGETDRIHQHNPAQLTIKQDNGNETVIDSRNHDSVVVWNPWQGAASMSDMDAFGYRQMLCVESAVTSGITLAPGDTHKLVQIIS